MILLFFVLLNLCIAVAKLDSCEEHSNKVSQNSLWFNSGSKNIVPRRTWHSLLKEACGDKECKTQAEPLHFLLEHYGTEPIVLTECPSIYWGTRYFTNTFLSEYIEEQNQKRFFLLF